VRDIRSRALTKPFTVIPLADQGSCSPRNTWSRALKTHGTIIDFTAAVTDPSKSDTSQITHDDYPNPPPLILDVSGIQKQEQEQAEQGRTWRQITSGFISRNHQQPREGR
jgi:hypothetical protein